MQHPGLTQGRAQQIAANCLGRRVERLHRIVSRRFEAELRSTGLSLPQFEMLTELAASDAPTRPSQLAGTLGLERSTISRGLDLLVQHGYVHPSVSPSGRTTDVQITESGLEVLARAEPAWEGGQRWLQAALGPDALSHLDRWLTAAEGEAPGTLA